MSTVHVTLLGDMCTRRLPESQDFDTVKCPTGVEPFPLAVVDAFLYSVVHSTFIMGILRPRPPTVDASLMLSSTCSVVVVVVVVFVAAAA